MRSMQNSVNNVTHPKRIDATFGANVHGECERWKGLRLMNKFKKCFKILIQNTIRWSIRYGQRIEKCELISRRVGIKHFVNGRIR